MHQSALDHMRYCADTFIDENKRVQIVDFGSRAVVGQKLTHRVIFDGRNCDIIGVDLEAGKNVDLVMKKPYSIPLRSSSADIVISGQVFEHIPFFWVSFLELARLVKPGGYIFLTAPSRGHVHNNPYDCWRFYPDGYKSLAKFSGLELRYVHTDFPPQQANRRYDYAAVPANKYWGDSVGVFQKTGNRNTIRLAVIRALLKWWANRNGEL